MSIQTWKTIDKMEVITHNPDYVLVGVYKWDNGTVHLVYGISKTGENEGLEAYYMHSHRSATNVDASLPFYKSRRWLTEKIPKKWQADFDRLKDYALEKGLI